MPCMVRDKKSSHDLSKSVSFFLVCDRWLSLKKILYSFKANRQKICAYIC